MATKLLDFIKLIQNNYTGPILIFDLKLIKKRLNFLQALGGKYNCKFLMPAKSFRHLTIYQLVSEYLWGFDVSNPNEYGYLPEALNGKLVSLVDPTFNGYKLKDFLAKKNDFIIYIETLEQYDKLQEEKIQVNFGVRLNSIFLLEECVNKNNPYYQSRFGTLPADLSLLKKMTKSRRHKFVGFHIHNGASENFLSTVVCFARKSIDLAQALGIEIKQISLGGGLSKIGFQQLEVLIKELRNFVDLDIQLIFEPGDLLFEGTGFACGRVKSRKIASMNYAFTLDLSKECHLRWSSPKLLYNYSDLSNKQIKVVFYGPTCYEGDKLGEFQVLVENESIPPYNIGDLVLFSNITGYSVSWNTTFNGINTAKVEFLN